MGLIDVLSWQTFQMSVLTLKGSWLEWKDEVLLVLVLLTKEYDHIKSEVTPSPDLRHTIDLCNTVAKDLMKTTYEGMAEANGVLGAQCERHHSQSWTSNVWAHRV